MTGCRRNDGGIAGETRVAERISCMGSDGTTGIEMPTRSLKFSWL